VAGEYAAVSAALDEAGAGPRLRLTDLRGGRTRWLDPLALEALVWAPPDLIEPLLDPARTRWAEGAPTGGDVAALVERLYPALASGDEATLLELLDDGFVGELADGFPAPIGGRHEGRRAMLDDGWWAIGRRFAVRAEPDGWHRLGAGGLLVTGRYRGRHRRSEVEIDAAFTHLWRAAGGRLAGLRQVTDTVAWGLGG
jgi:2-(1,2-epoxy-1,2-dihydrophenyl)acetyl-CoA isomerase